MAVEQCLVASDDGRLLIAFAVRSAAQPRARPCRDLSSLRTAELYSSILASRIRLTFLTSSSQTESLHPPTQFPFSQGDSQYSNMNKEICRSRVGARARVVLWKQRWPRSGRGFASSRGAPQRQEPGRDRTQFTLSTTVVLWLKLPEVPVTVTV
jgi:hypothetical protein